MRTKIDDRIKEEYEKYEAKIEGKFKIYLGDELYAKGKNKWTRYFVSSLVEFVVTHQIDYGACKPHISGLSHVCTARVGNDTTTPTSPDMSDLVSKVDIAPDTASRVIFKETDYTKYRTRHKFLWNPGTIPPQTIGEFGVYLLLTDDSWTSPMENPSFGGLYEESRIAVSNPAPRLAARISSGDRYFDPIYYDSSEALILEWYVTIKF